MMHLYRLILALVGLWLCLAVAAAQAAGSEYLGSHRCAGCHAEQYQDWQGSDHDRAMAAPDAASVRGNFADAKMSAHGVTSQFLRRGEQYVVRTDGPDGSLQDFPVRYTFGGDPLQQYLLELPGGRLQALSIAWDSRASAAGGQRWFHLYPESASINHSHPLHWTGAEQNWNYQCADCHSTALQKNYDPDSNTFATRWAEIDVGCEACHGAGGDHLAWAEGRKPDAENKGLRVKLPGPEAGIWKFNVAAGVPQRATPLATRAEIEVCARCHSRRSRIWPTDDVGATLLDSHQPALLQDELYFPDGQIRDEVYEYGSFLQSRMYATGVTCSDCHHSHRLQLRAEGNALCSSCHEARRYDQPEHHRHASGSAGAQCTACHMPERTYMGIDQRADHSLRVPRPDLTLSVGSPNACNGCHADRTAAWAQGKLDTWFPASRYRGAHFGHALHAARNGNPGAASQLLALANNRQAPPIVRATALNELSELQQPVQNDTLQLALQDSDGLVRMAALRYLANAGPQQQVTLGWPLLDDPARAVRLEAARVLAPLSQQGLPDAHRQYLKSRIEEYRQSQLTNAERPEAQLNLGLIAAVQGEVEQAEMAYRQALKLQPAFAPAYVNLADLYRVTGREQEGEKWLLRGMQAAPAAADVRHALGLLYVRTRREAPALTHLRQACELDPTNAHYRYVYALMQDQSGDAAAAAQTLRQVLQHQPAHRDAAVALIQIELKNGDRQAARAALDQIRQYYPGDAQLGQLEQLL